MEPATRGVLETRRRSAAGLVAGGIVCGVLGIVGYFAAVLRAGAWLPSVRNNAIPNWILIAVGLTLSTIGLVRARRRIVPGILLALNVVLAGWFATTLYVMWVVPPASAPPVGS